MYSSAERKELMDFCESLLIFFLTGDLFVSLTLLIIK